MWGQLGICITGMTNMRYEAQLKKLLQFMIMFDRLLYIFLCICAKASDTNQKTVLPLLSDAINFYGTFCLSIAGLSMRCQYNSFWKYLSVLFVTKRNRNAYFGVHGRFLDVNKRLVSDSNRNAECWGAEHVSSKNAIDGAWCINQSEYHTTRHRR